MRKFYIIVFFFCLVNQAVIGQEVRKLILNADDDQRYMTSKIYKLNHVKAADITPWVMGAVRRNCPQGKVERVVYKDGTSYLTVSTSIDMIPYIDDMIKKLDRPGVKDQYGSIINGTDVTFFSYVPKYRSTQNMVDVIVQTLQLRNTAFYICNMTNAFYWKGVLSDSMNGLVWLNFIDRPVPQVNIKLHIYEVTNNDLIDVGIDYIHWKNGPGLEMLGFGADILSLQGKEEILRRGLEIFTTANYAWGGAFVAPQFDASFVRLMQQRGKARIASSGSVTILNHSTDDYPDRVSAPVPTKTYEIQFTPNFQNITKDQKDMRVAVGTDDSTGPEIRFTITNPAIFFESKQKIHGQWDKYWDKHHPAARVVFDYTLESNNTVMRDNMGTEAVNSYRIVSAMNLPTGKEKLVGAFASEFDVKECIGIPFFKEIPLLKYLVSTTTRSRQTRRFIVTIKSEHIAHEANLAPWAGKVITEVDGTIKEVENGLAKE